MGWGGGGDGGESLDFFQSETPRPRVSPRPAESDVEQANLSAKDKETSKLASDLRVFQDVAPVLGRSTRQQGNTFASWPWVKANGIPFRLVGE